uniref:Uncharacterized protein n=1 Tax=Zea mays TaxID=4577 RepID=C0P4A3_MAIZE|nr:unknown [Zea mays]
MLRDTGIWTLGCAVINACSCCCPTRPASSLLQDAERSVGRREHRAGSQGASRGGSSRAGSTGRRSRERRAERREQDAGGRGI